MSGKAKKAAKAVGRSDRKATYKAAKHRDTPLVKATGWLAELGDQPQMIATSAATLAIGLFLKRRDVVRGGARMLASHLLATAAKTAIKRSVDRTRPDTAMEDGDHRFETGDSGDHAQTSFPSGHTAGAVAVARAAVRDIPGTAIPAGLAATAIAVAQPVNGKHYWSDLVAGAAIGWAAELAVSAVLPRAEAYGRLALRRATRSRRYASR